jgi:hypothetical protein
MTPLEMPAEEPAVRRFGNVPRTEPFPAAVIGSGSRDPVHATSLRPCHPGRVSMLRRMEARVGSE